MVSKTTLMQDKDSMRLVLTIWLNKYSARTTLLLTNKASIEMDIWSIIIDSWMVLYMGIFVENNK